MAFVACLMGVSRPSRFSNFCAISIKMQTVTRMSEVALSVPPLALMNSKTRGSRHDQSLLHCPASGIIQ
ncbi:MAG: hypothetical protein NWT12_16050, partial [Paracoccaceae bacterium]|nr:hypothetical protein [Paracoccaceae bacterium]